MTAKEELEARVANYRARIIKARDKMIEASALLNELQVELGIATAHGQFSPYKYTKSYNSTIRALSNTVYSAHLSQKIVHNTLGAAIEIAYRPLVEQLHVEPTTPPPAEEPATE